MQTLDRIGLAAETMNLSLRLDRRLRRRRHAAGLLQLTEAIDDLEQRVVDGFEGFGVALVRTAAERLERLQVVGQAGHGGCLDRRAGAGERANSGTGCLARGQQDVVVLAADRALKLFQPRRDYVHLGRAGAGDVARQFGDLIPVSGSKHCRSRQPAPGWLPAATRRRSGAPRSRGWPRAARLHVLPAASRDRRSDGQWRP